MPLDTSIAMSYKPMQLEDPLEVQARRQQIQANALAMRSQEAQGAEKNALARVISQPGYDPYNPEAQAAAFRVAPNLAPALFKNLTETRTAGRDYEIKGQALKTAERNEANAKKLDAITRVVGHNSIESVLADVNRSVATGEIDQAGADAIIATLPKTDADLPVWKNQTLNSLLSPKERLETTTTTENLGGFSRRTVAPKYAGGAPAQVTDTTKTADPGDVLRAETARLDRNASDERARLDRAAKGGDGDFLSKMSKNEQKDYRALVSTGKIIDSALTRIAKNEKAFGFGKGAATSFGGVTGGRIGASALAAGMTDDEIQARAYVYNVVSAAIKERAGTAQSAQELKVLDGFLPSPFDDARVISAKLNGFKQYLSTKRESYEPADGTEETAQGGSSPPASALQKGQNTTFSNGQVWSLDAQGKPVRIK